MLAGAVPSVYLLYSTRAVLCCAGLAVCVCVCVITAVKCTLPTVTSLVTRLWYTVDTFDTVEVGFLYSAAYAMTGPARFTISEVAVDWQELMVLQRKLRPSNCTR